MMRAESFKRLEVPFYCGTFDANKKEEEKKGDQQLLLVHILCSVQLLDNNSCKYANVRIVLWPINDMISYFLDDNNEKPKTTNQKTDPSL